VPPSSETNYWLRLRELQTSQPQNDATPTQQQVALEIQADLGGMRPHDHLYEREYND